MTKPFSPREVTARVKAILRRGRLVTGRGQGRQTMVEIDEEGYAAKFRGVRLELTRYEFRLLAVLVRRPGRVFSRDALMAAVWEDPAASLDRTVDAHVKMLRSKLRAVDDTVLPIVTHRGLGYSWSNGSGG